MRSGSASRAASAVLVLAALLAATPAPAPAQPPELGAILDRFRSMRGLSAHFREERRIALLSVPIRSEGELHFAPPGRMLRRVRTPTPSAVLIVGDRLTMAAGARRETIDLAEQPALGSLVGSFRDVLAGDGAALQRAFVVEVGGSGDGFELTLRPRAALRRLVRRIVIAGDGRVVRRMEMVEPNGDVTRTEFFDVDADRRWTRVQIEDVFRLR